MNHEQENGSAVFRKISEYKPVNNWRNHLIGRLLQTVDAPQQTMGKFLGLAVFSSDALATVAYGPQEVIFILAAAGIGSFHLAILIAIAICVLLLILTLSYEQRIHVYPGGGDRWLSFGRARFSIACSSNRYWNLSMKSMLTSSQMK